ncbi:unnamed protein product, partial [Pylaiella littoralis]
NSNSNNSKTVTRRSFTPPVSPAFSDGGRSGSRERMLTAETAANEPPIFVTVAQFCTLGVAEEGGALLAASAGAAAAKSAVTDVSGGDDAQGAGGQQEEVIAVGGGGAVTPAILPSLFPQASNNISVGCAAVVSEGVRMVLTSVDHEGGAVAT